MTDSRDKEQREGSARAASRHNELVTERTAVSQIPRKNPIGMLLVRSRNNGLMRFSLPLKLCDLIKAQGQKSMVNPRQGGADDDGKLIDEAMYGRLQRRAGGGGGRARGGRSSRSGSQNEWRIHPRADCGIDHSGNTGALGGVVGDLDRPGVWEEGKDMLLCGIDRSVEAGGRVYARHAINDEDDGERTLIFTTEFGSLAWVNLLCNCLKRRT